jgi:hypothetical protein
MIFYFFDGANVKIYGESTENEGFNSRNEMIKLRLFNFRNQNISFPLKSVIKISFCLPNRFFGLTFASLSNNPHRNRLFGYKEEWRDRAQRSSGNHLITNRKGANTRPETEL